MSEDRTTATDGGVQTSLQSFAEGEPGVGADAGLKEATTERLTIHDDGITPLLAQGGHAQTPSELVIMPSELHRRTLKRRLTDIGVPSDAFRFAKPRDVAEQMLVAALATPPTALDRIDRLQLLETVLETDGPARTHLQRVIGTSLPATLKRVEQVCTEIESITGYHPERVAALQEWCDTTTTPAAADTRDLLVGTLAVERQLRERSGKLASSDAVVRRACRILTADPSVWETAFSAIERVLVYGVSTLSAALVDLLASILQATELEAHVGCRPASGGVTATRLRTVLDISSPGQEVFDGGSP